MPSSIVRTRVIKGSPLSNEPGSARFHTVVNHSSVKRVGVAPRAGLPENAPAKAVGVDCGARFLKIHPVTNPVVDPISHGWNFDDPVFLKDLTFTLSGNMTRILFRHKLLSQPSASRRNENQFHP